MSNKLLGPTRADNNIRRRMRRWCRSVFHGDRPWSVLFGEYVGLDGQDGRLALKKVDRLALLAAAEGESAGAQNVNCSCCVTSRKSREIELVAKCVSYVIEGVIVVAQGVKSEGEWDSKFPRTMASLSL
jgi:hypothetical protein